MTNEEAIEDLELALATGNYIFTKSKETLRMAISALKQYDGMTNGEVLKAILPSTTIFENKYDVEEKCVDVFIKGEDIQNRYTKKWWNSLYKKGGNE